MADPQEDFGFIPDDDGFDFQIDTEEDFGFIPDEPVKIDTPATVEFKVDQSFAVAEAETFNQVDFTNDVMSMPTEVDFAPIADPSELVVTPDTLEAARQAESGNQIGFTEALKDKAGRPLELLPFVGPLYKMDRIGSVIKAAERIQKNPNPPSLDDPFVPLDATPQQLAGAQVEWMRDRYLVASWLAELEERQDRGISAGGKIAEGILELPSFMVEFLATSGVYTAAKQGTKVTIAKLLQRAGAKVSKEFAEKVGVQTGIKLISATAGVLAGTAARTGVQFTRVLENSFQRQVPGVEITPEGEVAFQEAQDTPLSAIVKGFGSVYIENLTEIAGEGFAKIPFLAKFNDELRDAWLIANPSKTTADFTKSIATKAGYNGFISELAEEQLATILNAATGIETFGAIQTGDKVQDFIARMVAAIPDGEDLLVQAGILVVPGAVKAVASVAERGLSEPARAITPTEAPIDPETVTKPVQPKQEGAVFHVTSKGGFDIPDVNKKGLAFVSTDPKAFEKSTSKFIFEAGKKGRTIELQLKPDAKIFDTSNPEHMKLISSELDQIAQDFDMTKEELTKKLAKGDFEDVEGFLLDDKAIKDKIASGFDGAFVNEGGARNIALFNPKDSLSQPTPQAEDVTVGEIRSLKKQPVDRQIEVAKAQAKEPIDRTSEDAPAEIQNRVALVKNMSPDARKQVEAESVKAVKSRISFKKPKTGVKEGLSNLLLKTGKAFRTEFAGLEKAVKAADPDKKLAPADDPVQLAVAFTQKSSAKTRGFVMEATTDLAGNRKSKSLKEIFKPIIGKGGKKNFESFVTYLVAARDINLQQQGKETGIDPVAARLTFDSLNSPEYQQAAKEVTEWNQKGIDLLVESGRISKESGEAIKLANPIYAPFFREFAAKEQVTTGKGQKFKPKRLKGSGRKIVDPIEGMIQQMDAMIQSAQRASIERSIANLALDNPEALEDFIKPIKAKVKPTKLSVDEVKSQLEEFGVDFTGVPEADLGELLTIFRPSETQGPGVVKLTVDGKDKLFRVQQDLLDVLEGTDNYKLGPFWDIAVGKPTRALKLGATGVNASFGLIRNPIRDIQTFTVTSEFAKGGPLSAIGGILKDVKTKTAGIAENFGFEGIKPDSDVQKFSALGGEMSGFITQDRAGTKHIQHDMLASNGVRYTINTLAHPVDALRALIGITEIGTRIGEFSPALKEGERLYGKGSLSASVFALNAAQDVTTNFTRHGQIGKQINQIIPFFNAAIQGPDKIVRSFKARPLKSTVAAVSTLTVPALFFWWQNKDKPWYQNLTAHEKANYIHFESPQDEDVVFRFPVPFELGHIFQAAPVAFMDAVHRDNPSEVKDILVATLKTSNPLDWPSLIGPVIDIKANEDFAGRPIVSRANEGKLPADQFGPQTTELMKTIGKQLNMSPSQIEHMVNSYSGGIYNRVSRMIKSGDIEKQPADLPIIGTLFVRDPFAPKRQVQEFYAERKLLNQKFQSKDITAEEVLRRAVVNNMATVFNGLFEALKVAKTTEQRKNAWNGIKSGIEFVDDLVPKGDGNGQ